MGALIRTYRWAETPLGDPGGWPQSLRCMVEMCVNSPLLGAVLWGPDLLMLYNDPCGVSLGERHPAALGRPVGEVWGDSWEEVSAPFLEAMMSGQGFARHGIRLEMARNGRRETTWWDFSAAPIHDEAGLVAGLLNQGVETTAQVGALEAARAAEELYNLALSAGGGVGAWDWDVANDRIVADERFAHLYGVDAAAAKAGAPVAAYFGGIHADDLPLLSAAVERSLSTGCALGEEYRVNGGEGERWVSVRGRPQLDAQGKPTRFPGVAFDVTERHEAEVALQSSEALGRQILDSAVDYAIFATNLAGLVTRWNQGAARVLGWTEAEMLGRSVERIFTPDDLAAGRPELEMRLAVAEGSGVDDRWHVRASGERFWASGKMTPLRDDAGRLVGYVKVLRDQTVERRQSQQLTLLGRVSAELLKAEQPDDILSEILEASAGLFEFDQSFNFVLGSDGQHLLLTQSFGVSVERQAALHVAPPDGLLCGIVAKTGRTLILEGLQDTKDERLAVERAAGLSAYAGYPIRSRDRLSGVLAFGSTSRPAFGAQSLSFFETLAQYVSVVRERADRDAALKELNATLETRVDERSRLLMEAEERLRQSQKMEAVGKLTGGLAHDFNNLLTAITGSLELLGMRVAQGRFDELDRYVGVAQGASNRAAALTHRLLAFSRQQTLDPKPISVNRLVVEMEDLVRRTVGPEVALAVVAADGLWPALVDPNQLENALLNLCINARDAMPGGGRMTIETANVWLDEGDARERELPPGSYLSLCVSDTGTGMSPDVVARAFDPFFTTKPLGQGTGLGLSMIYGFARQSGGQVRIRSVVGQGTRVCLFLPRFVGTAGETTATAEPDPSRRAGQGETVLVVDDEPTVRMLVVEVLEELGYATLEAADGRAGLVVLQSSARVDLLVTDVGLPGGIDGRQVADAGRRARPGLKVLFITGYEETAIGGSGPFDREMQVLTKPFAIEALATRVKAMLAG
jgi:PAS domain S-box-containing protein